MYQLKDDEYLKVLKMYKESKYQIPMIQSVIEGKLEGRVFADNDTDPETAVIITNFNWIYVIGNQESECFKSEFAKFISEKLVIDGDQFAWFGLSEYWQMKLKEMLDEEVRSFPRIKFLFSEEAHKKSVPRNKLLNEYKIHLIDSNSVGKASEFFDGIKMFWRTNENFLSNSFGFCAEHNGEIISVCQALAITGDVCEIDIFTDKNYRGQEIAYHLCLTFINHCLELGLKPYWETVRANTSSCKLAQKLGFIEVEEYPFYAWFKDK